MQITHNVDYNALCALIRRDIDVRASRMIDADASAYERLSVTERTMSTMRDYIRQSVTDAVSMIVQRYTSSVEVSDDESASIYISIDLPRNAVVDDARVWALLDDYARHSASAMWYATALAALRKLLTTRTAPTRTAPTRKERLSTDYE